MQNERPAAPRTVHLDARQVRTLAHPLRMRLLGTLRADGPATATTLADKLDTNTGATSYHLRQLAEVGLVTEDLDRGTGRQRWWRAAHDISNFEPTDFDDDPDARAAVQWIQADQVRLLAELAERWMAAEHGYSRQWRDAAGMSDVLLTLGPARLRALNDELWQLLERYRDEQVPDEPEAESVLVFLAAFPRVEGKR
ncbi:ArsR/SmtB family transcription factor [Micromonospora echinofusca]|uniref:Transcriptional regulator, ArsR family n=1 Tax=Micromonospora echinofusca TaxID=47858 RepID=A0A1C5GBG1_MICEH|nr:helix-turn-helix domain-containing protein [Micromonospora echinofusca]SCG17219.1 transcriptional regulator, ArsR family [Micromonospora echinofusca]